MNKHFLFGKVGGKYNLCGMRLLKSILNYLFKPIRLKKS